MDYISLCFMFGASYEDKCYIWASESLKLESERSL
jgi:hypothetical protein